MLSDANAELLSAYLDGELTPRQEKTVARLLEVSAEARMLLAKLERDALGIRQLTPCKLSCDLTDSILATLAAETPPLRRSLAFPDKQAAPVRSTPRWFRHAAAAAVLLAAGLGSYLYVQSSNRTNDDGLVVLPAPVAKPVEPVVENRTPVDEPELPHRPGSESVFAFPSRKVTDLRSAQARIPLTQLLAELEEAQIHEQLRLKQRQQDAATQIDLYCPSTAQGLERLQAVCLASGIPLRVEATVARRKGAVAIYIENMKPDDVTALLRELGNAHDGKASPFAVCVIGAGPVGADDLARVLGGARKDFEPAVQRPLEHGTLGEIIHSMPRPGNEPGKFRTLLPQRVAVAVPHGQATKRWKEVQALVDGYRECRTGSMPLLLVLHPAP